VQTPDYTGRRKAEQLPHSAGELVGIVMPKNRKPSQYDGGDRDGKQQNPQAEAPWRMSK
jgi:hypothetical protein